MPGPDIITPNQLARLLGAPDAHIILDVRTDEDFARDTRTLPGTVRRDFRTVSSWVGDFAGRNVAVVCQRGLKLSQGVAAWLRHAGTLAEALHLWLRIGQLSFGGPADQIALPHRDVVDERHWIGERRFLQALTFRTLLPGPEARQLATNLGWMMHGFAVTAAAGLLLRFALGL